MISAGVCASDAHYVWGSAKFSDYQQTGPLVLGHEGAGVVEAIGDTVGDLTVGDHVLTTFMPMCNDCAYCSNPLTNLCAKQSLFELGIRPNKTLASNGSPLLGLAGLGVYSEYVLLDQSQVVKVNN